MSAAARLNSKLKRSFSFLHDGSDKPIEVVCTYSDSTSNVFDVEVAIENEEKQSFLNVGATLDGEHSTEQTLVMAVDMDERRCRVNAVHDQDQVIVFNEVPSTLLLLILQLGSVSLTLPPPAFAVSDQSAGSGPASNSVKSPMPCKIAQVMVKPGQKVSKGIFLFKKLTLRNALDYSGGHEDGTCYARTHGRHR